MVQSVDGRILGSRERSLLIEIWKFSALSVGKGMGEF